MFEDLIDALPRSRTASAYFSQTPVAELAETACDACGGNITEDAFYFENGEEFGHYCEQCAQESTDQWGEEAKAYAEQACKITKQLPTYDYSNEYSCTSEEYQNEERDSNTPNAYLSRTRHTCTNYDELIKDLSRLGARDRVYYDAIRHRIDKLLTHHEGFMREEDC